MKLEHEASSFSSPVYVKYKSIIHTHILLPNWIFSHGHFKNGPNFTQFENYKLLLEILSSI